MVCYMFKMVKVVEAGDFSQLHAKYANAEIVDYSGKLILD